MIAREPLDLTRVDELLGLLSGADLATRGYVADKLAAEVPALVAELRALQAKRDRRHLMGIAERLRAERDGLTAEVRLAWGEVERLRAMVRRVIALTRTTDGDELSPDAEIPVGELYRVLYVEPGAALPERTAVPGEPLPPIPDSAHPADATPLDTPEAVDRELRRLAAETGEPYEIVRDLYDAMVACGEEHLIERDQHELSLAEFSTLDQDGKRWWVLRGPSGAISLTAAVVPAGTKLPRLSTAMMVRDRDGSALFPDCFTAHRPGDDRECPALPGGCDADGDAISGAAKVLESWAATGNDDDVIRDALVDVYRRELLGGDR
ncbi:hypothetical protein O7626_41090 [Micromonospora sp. WMMD1102]|uniref:hypothetical protein n=1 Tax=Micromonospora sp. WMMD1102 TaxID=3016105 RepID=UPI0024155015|nr:hypothetical protein [Micromonospora sp. WMMD1102]MDG4784383.1 hypothetical protein [Micromonospora sp. WMMD1102]MDG4792201.1 hypothetical protein [Micromonospora sp. WMMD1102]